jgi:hypothetical protein
MATKRTKAYQFDPESMDSKLTEIQTKLQGHFQDDTVRFGEQKVLLTEILAQVRATNGRVTTLETYKAINDAAMQNRELSRRNRKWIIGVGLTGVASWITLLLKILHIF